MDFNRESLDRCSRTLENQLNQKCMDYVLFYVSVINKQPTEFSKYIRKHCFLKIQTNQVLFGGYHFYLEMVNIEILQVLTSKYLD